MIPLDVVERWLADKHVMLWMDWDITDPKERRAAAEWFRHEIEDLVHTMNQRPSKPPLGLPPPNEWTRYFDMNLPIDPTLPREKQTWPGRLCITNREIGWHQP